MPKKEVTQYICDRCGKVINGYVNHVGAFHYMHIFKWYVPIVCGYKLHYICEDCFKSFKKWYKSEEEEVE